MQQKKETIKSDIRPGEVLWLIQMDEHGNLILNVLCTTGQVDYSRFVHCTHPEKLNID